MAAALATAADLPPEFAGVDSGTATYWLRIAEHGVSVGRDGDRTSDRHAMLAAHYLELMGHGSGAGMNVTSRSVGDISESYVVAAATTASLSSTKYGQIYLSMAPWRGPVVA